MVFRYSSATIARPCYTSANVRLCNVAMGVCGERRLLSFHRLSLVPLQSSGRTRLRTHSEPANWWREPRVPRLADVASDSRTRALPEEGHLSIYLSERVLSPDLYDKESRRRLFIMCVFAARASPRTLCIASVESRDLRVP